MDSVQEKRIIKKLSDGVRVLEISPYKYENGKVQYHLNLLKEKIIICFEIKMEDLKKGLSKAVFIITKVYYFEESKKTPANSKIIGKRFRLKSISNLRTVQKSTTQFNLTGILFLQ